MTIQTLVLPIKTRALTCLSLGESDCKGLSELLNVNQENMKVYLYYWEDDGVIQRVNPGGRPVLYKLSPKGEEELRRRR